ncbi:Hypothetical protein CAP_7815 [Chondromyces apiculatus DSM 436]|uniref:Uncharacterized protein n=1 Tax=Chondromyces apiculatus DSM 436 TaxID=1192034 RepID=A0A017SXN2_9BACT|nr:Hypothetical protein CAP_7815 [Chondromyces apiculatus DSM 436]
MPGVCGLLAGAALLTASGSAAADVDGAALFVLPTDRAWIQEALSIEAEEARADALAAARAEAAEQEHDEEEAGAAPNGVVALLSPLRFLVPRIERLQDIGVMPVMPLWMGFNGFGLKVRGKMP